MCSFLTSWSLRVVMRLTEHIAVPSVSVPSSKAGAALSSSLASHIASLLPCSNHASSHSPLRLQGRGHRTHILIAEVASHLGTVLENHPGFYGLVSWLQITEDWSRMGQNGEDICCLAGPEIQRQRCSRSAEGSTVFQSFLLSIFPFNYPQPVSSVHATVTPTCSSSHRARS